MKLVFAGTPLPAVPSLEALINSEHEVAAVITRHDAELGRKRVLTPSPVAVVAAANGIPLIKANRLDDAATEAVRALQPDLGVIVAYGGLVREPLLSVPRLGWINLHFSLLPRWRGAAPVQHAVIAGEQETGAAVFQLVPALDAGPIFGMIHERIGADQTAGELLESLGVSGAELLVRVVDQLATGTARSIEQVGEVTLAPKLGLADARIDWTRSAEAVYQRVRGVTPEPGAFTMLGDTRLKLIEMARTTGDDSLQPGVIRLIDGEVQIGTGTTPLELVTVQPAGKKPMRATDWWRGLATEEVVAS
ncbi:methionyl-tRNA formyltransferase [Leifsonia sp. A12D58]|uniref:methionyl-tRNA formyltransferase n=1 Tax=Leifsonia sp. A12D58 TaxID=3397674 RepID=UPI0039E03530